MRHDPGVSEPAQTPTGRAAPLPRASISRLVVPVSVVALVLTGAVLLIVAEFTTLFQVQAISVVVKTAKTGPHHSYAQLLIAAGAVGMALLYARTGHHGPLLALAALGAIALLIGIVGDLPDTHAAGHLAQTFEFAKATPRAGLWLELAGGACLLVAGLAGVLLSPARRDRADDRRAAE